MFRHAISTQHFWLGLFHKVGGAWKEAESSSETIDVEWTVPWGSPHRLGNAHTVGAQNAVEAKIKIT